MEEIRKYLLYLGFEEVPCRIPKNKTQIFKRHIYLFIKNYSNKLFDFLLKVSPIKFLKERPNKSIWFSFYDNGKIVTEIEIIPFNFIPSGYQQLTHIRMYNSEGLLEYFHNDKSTIKEFKEFLYRDKYIKSLIRDRKIESILT